MTTNSNTTRHPYDLLEAFALDALDPAEEQLVADHLEWCLHCYALVGENLRVATALAQSVELHAPPEALRSRVLDIIEPRNAPTLQPRVSVSTPGSPRSWSRVSSVFTGRWVRALAPATTALAAVVIAIAVVLNLQVAGDLDAVQSENSLLQQRMDRSMATTTALAASSSRTVDQMQGSLRRWQQTSYALAQPGNQTLVLTAARADVGAQGVLVLAEDGSAAVLMVSDLARPQPDSVYHVWLTRGGQRYWAGEMDVDERGWGTMTLSPLESLAQYDSVQLSMGKGVAAALAAPPGSPERATATASMVGDMILVTSLQ